MKPFNLGTSSSERMPPHNGPMGDKEVSYPEFTYRGPLDLDLPEHGEMTIHFCVLSETSAGRPSGERYYECTIAVKKILDFKEEPEKGDAPTRSYNEADDALDKIAEENYGEEKE